MGMPDEARIGSRSRLLVIERDASSGRVLAESLADSLVPAPRLCVVSGGRQGAETLKGESFDVVFADLASLADLAEPAQQAVARLARLARGALVIVLSDGASVSAAVAAMRAGAHDYVAKPIGGPALAARLAELAERHGKARAIPIETRPHRGVADCAGFIGASSAMQFVYEQIERIAASSAPVFITGESGTGKDVCAEALHAKGARADRPFIAINCAAIPRDLMESELFGAARGAYTGAHEDRKGAAELADGGTLFLDEIGEMDLSLQSKLLRFLQTGAISRVGESGARRLDVRVICATNRNPMQMIAERRFREDLFYRLHVLPIHLPPLRQRPADVMALAAHFLDKFAREERKRFTGFDAEAAARLTARDWPGNVRQLQNVVRRLVVMFDGGRIDSRMVEAADIDFGPTLVTPANAPERADRRLPVLPMWRQEQRIIEDAIAVFNGNISLAAAALEISPSTIYRKRQSWAGTSQAGAA